MALVSSAAPAPARCQQQRSRAQDQKDTALLPAIRAQLYLGVFLLPPHTLQTHLYDFGKIYNERKCIVVTVDEEKNAMWNFI